MRPNAVTVSGEAPTVSFIPIQPPKSLRSGGEFNAKPVRKLVEDPPGSWKFAVTVRGADRMTLCGFVLPLRSPLQLVNVPLPAAAAVNWTEVPLS